MASSGVVLLLVTMLWTDATAQSGCTSVLIGMAPCLSYVTASSSTPSSSCCSQLASVVQSQPQCLCTALNGGGSALGVNINQTLALALPGACNVQTLPVSKCDAANEPATSPVNSSVTGSKAVPSNGTT
uniref:Bifunctional inhibitor/plant lipid transfer protein/seed storage helical domain-containing protein n=1 Tax=Davidia involucrata TaxID=16924 RepID=A0A5B7BX39_DAVIN